MPSSSRPTEAATVKVRVVTSAVAELVGRELELGDGPAVIGRADDCDFPVADPSMSRRHARVEAAGEVLRLTDNGSANGVFVGGTRVPEAELGSGARFTLGQTEFEVVVELPPPPEPVAAAPVAAAPVDPGATMMMDRTMSISDIQDIVREFARPKSLEEEGEQLVTAANKPFVISNPEDVYLVESGKVEIFTVQLDAGRPVGARTHFVTVEAGQAFFGMDTDRYGMGSGFLAVGKAGSELRKYSSARLMRLASVAEHGARIAKLVATWVEALSQRLVKDLPLPTVDVLLEIGAEAEIPADKKAACSKGLGWIEMPAAQFLFDGMGSLSYEVEGVLFPLGPGSWVELLAGAESMKVTPRPTAQAIGDPRLWAGLDVFQRILCECEFLNKRLATVDEYNRLQDKAVQVEAAKEAAYNAIGSVLGGTGIWERPALAGADIEPIFRACELLGRSLGITFRNHPDAREIRTFEESILAIGLASRVRTRRVALVDDWWVLDQGPLLGQVEESQTPVALLPTSATSYEAIEPATGARRKVDAEYVKGLAPFAYTFYRSFSDGIVSAREVIQFSLSGLGGEFRMVALMGVGLGILGTLPPMITGKVFDQAIPQAERGMLFQFSLGLLLVAITQAAFKITQAIAMIRVQGKMDYSAQAAVWDRLMDLPQTFFRKFSAGDLADRAGGIDQIRAIVAGAGISALLGTFASIFNVFQMTTYSMKLAAIAIGLTLLYVASTTTANYVQLRYQREQQKLRGRIMGLVLQLITGVAKLRVCGAENHAFRTWATSFAEQRKVEFAIGRVKNVMAVFNAGFPVLSSMVLFTTMVALKADAAKSGESFEMSTGDFLAFTAAYGVFMAAMQALGDASLSMLKIVPVWERLKPILETLPEVDATKAYPGKLTGAIEISHLSFRYSEDGPWILRDISLSIKPGEFVALVGGSGSGKSTLMRIMLGFEKPEMGSVYYDRQDLGTLDLRMVRQQLGVVLQESRLLPADIFRNIVGSSSRTVAEAWDAAEKAGLADDVRAMPMQMHTVISEGGGAFSGGQKQRLMIARAIVHKPKILYLDEATSALDNKTQAIVTESMDKLAATRVVIAHRLSTIVNADRICYLEKGQLMESGTFQELMEKDGLFAQLAKRQLA
jgi:NHLM bacteriocin system ABC transporter ATP-binding protein